MPGRAPTRTRTRARARAREEVARALSRTRALPGSFASAAPRTATLCFFLTLALLPALALDSARAAVSARPPKAVEFWIVEPNEGQSAGGHAAIRIGEWIYHVEHRGDGLIADRRTPRARFEEIYRLRDNRGIEAISLDLAADRRDALGEALERRFYARKRRLDRLDALESEARWLGAARDRGALSIAVPGLGLFEARGEGPCTTSSRTRRRALRDLHAERHGALALGLARREARDRTLRLLRGRLIEGVDDEPGRSEPPGRNPVSGRTRDRPRDLPIESGHGGAHRRLQEAAQKWAALELLFECRELRAAHLEHAALDADPRDDQVEAWKRIRAELETRFVTLLASRRDDVGLSLLLTLARLDALDRSIEARRLFVLDPRSEDPRRAPSRAGNLPKKWLAQQALRARSDWRRALGQFESGEGPLEARIAAMEGAHHAYRHVLDGTLHPTRPPTRDETRRISPSASVGVHYAGAEWLLPWPDNGSHSALARAHERAVRRAKVERENARRELHYGLLTQNCVTELLSILAAIDAPRDRAASSKTAEANLVFTGRFIPAVAGRFVEEHLANGPRRSMPSTRREQLARDSDGRHGLRELSTLTSETYRSHDEDSSFLLFADGPVWLRPAFGIANLSYGIGAAGVGILRSPFDGGVALRRGLQGAMMSVPELFFFQVRRGTYLATDPFRSVSDETALQE